MNKANECTCPSGDGSLVHPCPAHPAVEQACWDERKLSDLGNELHNLSCSIVHENEKLAEQIGGIARELWNWPQACAALAQPSPAHPAPVEQAGGDERAAFEAAFAAMGRPVCRADYDQDAYGTPFDDGGWTGWQARAALAQPSPMYDPKRCLACGGDHGNSGLPCPNMRVTAQAQPSPKCVKCGGTGEADSGGVHPWGEPVLIPCDCETEQAVAERPEVVAYADPVAFATFKERGHEGGVAGREWMWAEPGAALVAMSRTDECERIVGALREQYECNTAIMHARTEALSRVTSERDAALSRVAELEKQEPVATVAKVPGEDWNSLDFHRDLQDMQPGTKLYAAPLAQAQQLHDLDKQCRDDVARALGLRPNKERGFAWSYLLASIKSCVKASGDSAQAQHSVPEGWKLVPVEPTEDVLEAIHNGGYVGDDQELRWFYQSILAAAPAPGGE
ncbi:hypothetical protein ACOZBT_003004 [Pseudomonas aeruginosa]|nr:hypothetical protein [Pseudomonas aeruginosa]